MAETKKTNEITLSRVEIYSLCCPVSGAVRYIGKANDTKKRLKSHIRDSKTRNTRVYQWIRSLAKDGLMPVAKVIMVSDSEKWQEHERELISKERENGADLLNMAEGGDQPLCSVETRRENAVKLNHKFATDPKARRIREIKRALGDALRRGYLNEKTKANMRLAAAKSPRIFGEWASIK